MQNLRESNKRIIVSVIMTLMMILAMMPSMAFAAEGDATSGSISSINAPATLAAGVMDEVTGEFTANGAAHIDWSVTGDAATINKHKGELTAVSEGTVTVKATLHAGKAEQTGQGQECSGAVLDTKTAAVTITAAQAYGFQGEGGNTLKLTSPENIIFTEMGTLNEKNVYKNSIISTVTAVNDTISFGYTMSAGINNFQETTFEGYQDEIGIFDRNGTTKLVPVSFGGFSNRTVTINADVSSLSAGIYTLRFGPAVCGNNTLKKLDCYLDFTFTLVK